MNIKEFQISALISLLVLIFLSGCVKNKCSKIVTKKAYSPVYMSYDSLRNAVTTSNPREVVNPGKIYVKGDYLLINERNRGIHIVNNSDPANPRLVSFVRIPGNIDMAVKGNVLYADSYIDLVALDISNPEQPKEISREEEVFPYNAYQYRPYEGKYVRSIDPDHGVVVDWKYGRVRDTVTCENSQRNWVRLDGGGFANQSGAKSSASSSGEGGSMARFTIAGDYLYTVEGRNLQFFDLSNPRQFDKKGSETVDITIETIFDYQNHLFIGAQNGMYIYSIQSPTSPTHVSTYEHIRQCDPVVVQDTFAYVTLRGNGNCWGAVNRLDVVNISDLSDPHEAASYEMSNPYGLGVEDNDLYVCDRGVGMRIYDNSRAPHLDSVNNVDISKPYDLIPIGDLIIVTAESGIYQYDMTDRSQPQELSRIPVASS